MPKKGEHDSPETREKKRRSHLGKKRPPFSAETRARMRLSHLGKKQPPEAIEKTRLANTGMKRSPEVCAKISMSLLGKTHTPEQNEKNRVAQLGRKLTSEQLDRFTMAHRTPETREKRRLSHLGKKGWHHTPKAREKIHLALSGHTTSPETRAKIGLGNMGKKMSPEARMKISAGIKGMKRSTDTRRKMAISGKRKFEDPEYIKRWACSINARPTRPEKHMDALLQAGWPGGFKYNGGRDGNPINGFIPDFIAKDSSKRVIEVFGSWKAIHPPEDEKIKKDRYAEYGYECLIIWDYELKDEKAVIARIAAFVGSAPRHYFDQYQTVGSPPEGAGFAPSVIAASMPDVQGTPIDQHACNAPMPAQATGAILPTSLGKV